MRRGPVIYSALLTLICAGLLAGTAAAATKATPPPPKQEEVRPPNGFELEGTNGWSIAVSTYTGEPGGHGSIGVTASRGKESASYSAPAKVTADSVRADLGRFGRVDVRIQG